MQRHILYLVELDYSIEGGFQDMLCSLRRFDRSEGAQQRMKIIRFYEVYPLTIKSWQSDNGKENLGEFDKELKREEIPHYFSYPRCPKINTYIERYNRTIQEEFIDNNLDIIYDKPVFHKRLAEYLIFYNTERPHKSLGQKSPLEYLVEKGGMSQMYV